MANIPCPSLVDMTTYIATFFCHFGAMRFKKLCDRLGWPARMMPVPRNLSSSCGTCVRYEGKWRSLSGSQLEEVEQIVQVDEGAYHPVYQANDL